MHHCTRASDHLHLICVTEQLRDIWAECSAHARSNSEPWPWGVFHQDAFGSASGCARVRLGAYHLIFYYTLTQNKWQAPNLILVGKLP